MIKQQQLILETSALPPPIPAMRAVLSGWSGGGKSPPESPDPLQFAAKEVPVTVLSEILKF